MSSGTWSTAERTARRYVLLCETTGTGRNFRWWQYLRAGTVLAATGARLYDVLSPGRELIGGLRLLTDGQWFWYSDLAHYVERYHVAVNEQFLQHARRRNWNPPRLSHTDLDGIQERLFRDES
ncbi:hypothetical protein [Streptomyces sp. NPDC002994]|uniref:hypothetical protein n=1 Tax=Streptomyces sp. NPDC002994 TaxID=3154441 RepID=UPI0033A97ED3